MYNTRVHDAHVYTRPLEQFFVYLLLHTRTINQAERYSTTDGHTEPIFHNCEEATVNIGPVVGLRTGILEF